MANRIRKDDIVKIIAGDHKGTTGKVLSVTASGALIEGVGLKTRHVKPSQLNPRGGKKDIHVATPLHKLALGVDENATKTSRVGYKVVSGVKSRVARQLKDKEIK